MDELGYLLHTLVVGYFNLCLFGGGLVLIINALENDK